MKHTFIYLLLLIPFYAKTQITINNWVLDASSSLTISHDTISSQIGNSGPRAIAPYLVLNSCDYDVSSNPPYINTTVIKIPSSTTTTTGELVMGYKTDDDHASTEYYFVISNRGHGGILKVTPYINTTPQTFCTSVDTATNGTQFKLELKNNDTLCLYQDGNPICSLALSLVERGRFFIEALHGNQGSTVARATRAWYPCTNSAFYVDLKTSLDGGMIQLYDDALRIKFVQEYATNGANDDISYTIYNWDRSNTSDDTFEASYGINWKDLDISGLSSGIYVLEVMANKGQKYYLRFKK